ncbi:ABC transporter permease [Virgibacillus sediminis]|uniref:ABC transporter permease n=1 Tax=Virgibacillus sediminis TaxID=202260 RepID=A0ABV7A361_9BACI
MRIPLWLAGLVVFTLLVPGAFSELYPSQEDRAGMAETMRNPAMTALVGPGELDNYTIGAMTSHQMLLFTALAVSLMNILLICRHTRGDEEEGRAEMLRALPIGRLSNLHATLLVMASTNMILALSTGIGLYFLGIDSMSFEGSLLYGAVLGCTGLFFAGVVAVSAQLAETSRGAMGISIAVLLVAYLTRGITDINNEKWSWLSPLGWVTKTGPYTANQWSPVLLLVAAAFVLMLVSYYLHANRDIGTGTLPSRAGRTSAGQTLKGPVALALKLQRTGTVAWGIGLLVMGLSYGSVLGELEGFFDGNELLEQMLLGDGGLTLTERFLPMLFVVMAILASIPPLMSILKLIGEEKKGRLDHLLGRELSRSRLMAGYLLVSATNAFVMLSLAAIGLWATGNAAMEEGMRFWPLYSSGILYYPAILCMLGLTILLIGFQPKYSKFIWLYLVYSFMAIYWGGLFDLPDWLSKLSPYGHVPQLPVEDMAAMPVVLLIVSALVLAVAGFIGYNRRDIQGD